MRKRFILVGVSFLAILLAVVLFSRKGGIERILPAACSISTISSASSPGGKYRVEMQTSRCLNGSSSVNVWLGKASPSAFVTESELLLKAPIEDAKSLSITWVDDYKVVLSVPKRLRGRLEPKFDNVTVQYLERE